MSILDSIDQRAADTKAERLRAQKAQKRFREDVQAFMAEPAHRRVVMEFMQVAGVDASVYQSMPTGMAFRAGWQDAGRWWLAAIRNHCPEREAQMRAEANRDAREGAIDEEDHGN